MNNEQTQTAMNYAAKLIAQVEQDKIFWECVYDEYAKKLNDTPLTERTDEQYKLENDALKKMVQINKVYEQIKNLK
jgi:broad specificity phosphatase PhoE